MDRNLVCHFTSQDKITIELYDSDTKRNNSVLQRFLDIPSLLERAHFVSPDQ
jgi:hypothetical protein